MRFLLDQNLAPRLNDDVVWHHAAEGGFTIVSKEADFHERSFLLGYPPKVIWIRRGNCSTDEVLSLLQTAHAEIIQFEADPEASLSSARLTRSPTHHATAAR